MHDFGKKGEFEIHYRTLIEKYEDDPELLKQLEREKKECYGEMHFILNNRNLFAIDDVNDRSFTTYAGNLFFLIKFFCRNLYFQIVDDPFPAKTMTQNAIDMMDEIKLVEGEDNDILKYLDVDFNKIDMELYRNIDVWNWRHGFVGNGSSSPLPDIYMRRVNGNQIEVSWDSRSPFKGDKGDYYFMHGKGVEYIDLKLYRDTVIAFCLDTFERLGKHFPLFIDDFKAELQKAIDVKL